MNQMYIARLSRAYANSPTEKSRQIFIFRPAIPAILANNARRLSSEYGMERYDKCVRDNAAHIGRTKNNREVAADPRRF